LRRVAALSREEQDAIASQILETLEDEAAWKQKLAGTQQKLRELADAAKREQQEGKPSRSTKSCDRIAHNALVPSRVCRTS